MSHSAQNFRKEILLFLRKFLVSKKYMDEKGGITFFRRNFLVSQCQKISWASPKCFRKFRVSKNFMHTRGYHVFPSKFFLSHSAENIRGHPFDVSENLGYRKILCIIGGITSFRRNFFVSQCRKIPWASLQCFRKFGVSKNFMHTRGITFFRRKIFVSQCRKYSGHPSDVSENLGYQKILCILGGITFFRRKFFVSQCR